MSAQLYVHLSWTTVQRRPMIGHSETRFLSRFLPAEAQRHNCDVIATGIVPDHVHVLIRIPRKLDLPRLLQGLKGASARLINQSDELSKTGIRWASGYDARTVSPGHLKRVADYVKGQTERHQGMGTLRG
ncbi:MAG: IS200/IS605 family transposase [Gemmatimonadota bacterium]|nr:MAG: IS200/IS605 family transposase [Gemmatimonadota bacterium]